MCAILTYLVLFLNNYIFQLFYIHEYLQYFCVRKVNTVLFMIINISLRTRFGLHQNFKCLRSFTLVGDRGLYPSNWDLGRDRILFD